MDVHQAFLLRIVSENHQLTVPLEHLGRLSDQLLLSGGLHGNRNTVGISVTDPGEEIRAAAVHDLIGTVHSGLIKPIIVMTGQYDMGSAVFEHLPCILTDQSVAYYDCRAALADLRFHPSVVPHLGKQQG